MLLYYARQGRDMANLQGVLGRLPQSRQGSIRSSGGIALMTAHTLSSP